MGSLYFVMGQHMPINLQGKANVGMFQPSFTDPLGVDTFRQPLRRHAVPEIISSDITGQAALFQG